MTSLSPTAQTISLNAASSLNLSNFKTLLIYEISFSVPSHFSIYHRLRKLNQLQLQPKHSHSIRHDMDINKDKNKNKGSSALNGSGGNLAAGAADIDGDEGMESNSPDKTEVTGLALVFVPSPCYSVKSNEPLNFGIFYFLRMDAIS